MGIGSLKKNGVALAFTLGSLAMSSNLFGGTYLGVFGGGGSTSKTHISQRGFAFNNADPRLALLVHATGRGGNYGVGLVGAHFGYEFDSGICLIPALGLEGFYLGSNSGEKVHLNNPTFFEHDFHNKLPLRAGVLLGEFVLSLRAPSTSKWRWIEPYVGGGFGGGVLWIHHAKATQLSPAEPDVNHFNSRTTASDSALAAQFKGGFRFNLNSHWRLFAEYRYIYFPSTSYMFGFTQYPTHVPTSNWIVKLGKLNFNLGVVGLDYKF